ncbi:hypothetical protein ACWGDE_05000 [Streptomyces sp. NPDC054956]
MKHRLAALLAVPAALLCTSCAGNLPRSGPELTAESVAGTWEATGKVSLSVEADGRFSTNAVPASGALITGDAARGGRWELNGNGNAGHTGLKLRFDEPEGELEPIPIDLVSHTEEGKLSLCVYIEPDDPCGGFLLTRSGG